MAGFKLNLDSYSKNQQIHQVEAKPQNVKHLLWKTLAMALKQPAATRREPV